MEVPSPKQEWKVAGACKPTNTPPGEVPVISRGLSRAGPGKNFPAVPDNEKRQAARGWFTRQRQRITAISKNNFKPTSGRGKREDFSFVLVSIPY